MKELKMKLLLVCALVLLVGAPVALADWDESMPFKWVQYPDLSDLGGDVDATAPPDPCLLPPVVLADDFLCEVTGDILDIHIWGSWLNDRLPLADPCSGFAGDPCAVAFVLSLHADIPADPDTAGSYSMPGQMLWYRAFFPGDFRVRPQFTDLNEGWFWPFADLWIPAADTVCWQYNFYLEPGEFRQEGTEQDPIVYWLDVQAYPADPCAFFGWKTSIDHWNDDAVWAIGTDDPCDPCFPPSWNELRYPEGHQYYPDSIDLAFVITGDQEVDELDFGDAPDALVALAYPTLLANNGARHIIGGPWFGPADDAPDAEADGQPDPDAMGDDNDAQGDDEDGIGIPTLIQNTIINITVEVAGGPAVVNGWIDWNDDGDWNDFGEHIINNVLLGNGVNPVPVTVPNNAAVGETFGRFRIKSNFGPSAPTGIRADGEVEDHKVTIEAKRKWSQPPVVIEPGDPPIYLGWDELSVYGGPQIVADDWPCEDYRPVSDVHWWGSYQYWDIPIPPEPAFAPIGFHIGIWTDVPVNPPLNLWSHPGQMIWEYNAGMVEVNEQFVGWDTYPTYPFDACFRYDLQLPDPNWFWQEGPENIYWISISAVYPDDIPQNPWGWKTREHFWNDDAVRIWIPSAPTVGGLPFIEGEPIVDPCGISMDMAFELTTYECMPNPGQTADPVGTAVGDSPEQQVPPLTTYDMWAAAGYPKCWCYVAQCRGNADGVTNGSPKGGYWRVGSDDLNILAAAFGIKEPPDDVGAANIYYNHPQLGPVSGICANFNRMLNGSPKGGYWHVGSNDLNRLSGTFLIKDPTVPLNDCGGSIDNTP